jgi:hypothetical protein
MKQTLAMIITIGFLAALALGVLVYIDAEPTSNSLNYYYTTVEITNQGYALSTSDVTTYELTDAEKQTLFEEARTRENAIAEYQEARAIAEADTADSFEEAEEDRIAEYCEEEGFASCYNIKYTCETEYTCYLVTIECDDSQYDPYKEIYDAKYACKDWKVTVDTEFDFREVDENYWENYGYVW